MAGGGTWQVSLRRLGKFIERIVHERSEDSVDPETDEIVERAVYVVISHHRDMLLTSARAVRDEMLGAGITRLPPGTSPIADAPQRALELLDKLMAAMEPRFEGSPPDKRRPIPSYDLPEAPGEYERVFRQAIRATPAQLARPATAALAGTRKPARKRSEPGAPRSKRAEADQALATFISYSHKDEAHRERLVRHLALLERRGVLALWHDRKILPGEEWDETISCNLEKADIILLLISADFLASDSCYEKEMQRAIERHEAGTATVIPIIVEPCEWQKAPFGRLQALPKSAKAVASWDNQAEAWSDVAAGIERAATGLLGRKGG
jgi:hypothetical protein